MKRSNTFIFILVLSLIQFLAHFVVYEGIMVIFGINSDFGVVVLRSLLGVLTFAFVVLMLVVSKYNNFFTRSLYKVFAVWQGFLLYFFLASSIFILAQAFGFYISSEIGKYLFILAGLVGIYGVVNAKLTRIKNLTVSLDNLPDVWKTKKVVWISDIHLGQVNSHKFLQKIVNKINNLNPDLVFIGGDLYDGVKVDTEKIIQPLRDLKVSGEVYFITGNHDGFTDKSTEEDIKAIESVGIKVLQDTLIEIDGVQVIGIDYKHSNPREKFRQRLVELNIKSDIPSILLKHVPSDVDIASDAGISFQISGHTHKAQMWPLSYLPKIIYKGFDYGLKHSNVTKVYVSSGVGTWGPPLRVGSKSEIVLIEFN